MLKLAEDLALRFIVTLMIGSAMLMAGSASVNAGTPGLGKRLDAAIDAYCAPFISSAGERPLPANAGNFPVITIESLPADHPAHRVPRGWASAIVGEANSDGFVTVLSSNDNERGPACTVIAHGPGANSAIMKRAENMRGRRSEWQLVENALGLGGEDLTFYEKQPHSREWTTELLLDLRDESESNLGSGMARLSRIPVWNEADHPEEPTLAELDVAKSMSIEEALLAATFEIGVPWVRDPNSDDPTFLRRTRVLAEGMVSTLIMRMSNDERMVGIIEREPNGGALGVFAQGPRAGHALDGVRKRLEQEDWRREHTSDSTNACYLSKDSVIEVCLPNSQPPDGVGIFLRRALRSKSNE